MRYVLGIDLGTSAVKAALKQAVSTFQDPDEVNATAVQAEEMRLAGSA